MRYFEQLPKMEYTFSNGVFTVPDLFIKVGIKDSFFQNPDLFYEEYSDKVLRPERLSFLKYGTFDYYWIMMLANKVYDVNRDWPSQQEELGTLLDNYSRKATFYVYENAEILPNDILYLNENSYGIIESWNPFYKQIILKESYNLPTTGLSSLKFKIKRMSRLTNSSQIEVVDLTNFCTTPSTDFNLFGYSNYASSPYQIFANDGKVLNPLISADGGTLSESEIIVDTCSQADKTAFQKTLIYRVINNLSVTGIKVRTYEQKTVSEYVDKVKLNVISTRIVPLIEDKAKLLFNDPTATSTSLFRTP